jgi:2-phosphosulfolactate phosphatase
MKPSINIVKSNLQTCHAAEGTVVVIDVLRAFTTTAFAFAQGAKEIVLVASVDEAFRLRKQAAEYLLMGEVNGLTIEGFDLPKSPSAIAPMKLDGRRFVMRTTAGTQGVVLAANARDIYVTSLCVATATANAIRENNPATVTFVETGRRAKDGGEEDCACADYIASLLLNVSTNIPEIQNRVLESAAAAKFLDVEGFDFPKADLQLALQVDRYTFAMKVEKIDNLSVLKPINLGQASTRFNPMPAAHQVRSATLEDAPALRKCMESAYAAYQHRMGGQRLPPLDADYLSEIKNYPTWVVEAGQQIVAGLIMVFEQDRALIANIAVDPQFQGLGIGGELMAFAESRTRDKDITELQLATHVLLTENLSLYAHLGWQELERNETRVLMRKALKIYR